MTAPTFTGNVQYVILPSPKDLPTVGGLFYGAVGADPPDATMEVDYDVFTHTGFLGEDGLDENEDRPTTKIFAWGGDIAAISQDSYSLTETFPLLEFLRPAVAKVAYGDENVTVTAATATTGTKMSIMVNSNVFAHRSWLVDTYGVGGKRVQKFVPLGRVTNKATQKTNHRTILSHNITMECFADVLGNYAYIRTDDGVYSV